MAEYNIQMNRYVLTSDSYDQLFPKTKTIDVVDQNGDNLDTLLGEKIDSNEKGAANGVASLGADGKVPSSQLPATGYSKEETLTVATAALFGLSNTAVPDDVFAWLGNLNLYCWKRRAHEITYSETKTTISTTERILNTGLSTLYYSNETEIDNSGVVHLKNPTSVIIPISTAGAEQIAALAPRYIQGSWQANADMVFYLPNGVTGGSPDAYSGSIFCNSGSAIYLSGVPDVTRAQIATATKTGDIYGEWETIFSQNRNEYPDSGDYNGYEYQYCGVPFDNAKNIPVKIENGSYVGTGTYGNSNQNSLMFDFEPKLVVVRATGGNGGHSWIIGCNNGEGGSNNWVTITWNSNTVAWYHDSSADFQLNASGMKYYYFAIG